MTDTHEDLGPVRYYLEGHGAIVHLRWEIPVRLWPLTGSIMSRPLLRIWGDSGEYPITKESADRLAAEMGSDLSAHPDSTWAITTSDVGPRPWKHIWMDTATQLQAVADQIKPDEGRVRHLIYRYAKATALLLHADVNGGLDDEYADYPEPPQ